MCARAGTTPIFADSPPGELPGGWAFATREDADVPLARAAAVHTPRWHWFVLLLLTLVGGSMRFAWLDRPSIWGDEAATYWRIMGSYEELLDLLGKTKFMPLHYQAGWALANPADAWLLAKLDMAGFVREQAVDPGARRLTPPMMRMIPAVCGTLMIPAMYFLARQVLTRRASLMAAAFTAFSAYVFVYSRDAKMYMPFFLALTLNMACFLWWMRTRASVAWLGWIAAGLATLGLHMSGLGVIALQPVYLLTQRRPHWLQAVLFTLGLGIIFAGPVGYYVYFNKFGERIEDQGWNETGIQWVEQRNRGHGAVELTFDSAAAYLFAWNFIPESHVGKLTPSRVTAATVVLAGFLGFCVLGALPWAMKLRGDRVSDPPGESWWRGMLWIGLWLVVPTFGVYCLSFPREQVISPRAWLTDFGGWLTGPWQLADNPSDPGGSTFRAVLQTRAFLLVSGIVLLGTLLLLWRMIPRIVAAVVGFAAVVMGLILGVSESGFTPLYDPQTPEDVRLRNGIYLIALMAVPPLLWYFSGRSLWERARKSLVFLVVMATLWGACYATFLSVKPADGSVWMPRYLAFIWPAAALGLSALLMRLPTRPLRWAAIGVVIAVNLGQIYGRVFLGNEPPLDRAVADVLADTNDPATLTFTPSLRTARNDDRLTVRYLGGAPGGATMWDLIGRYYFAYQSADPPSALQFTRWNPWRQHSSRRDASPAAIRAALAREPHATRIILWQQYPDEATARTSKNDLSDTLDGGWTLAAEEIFNVRFYWSWADLYTYSRREYVKAEGI